MILTIVLVILVLIWYVKYSGNKELIKEHCKTPNDKANIINAKKVYKNDRTSMALLILSIVALVIVLLVKFTKIDFLIHDYISTDIVEEKDFGYIIFLIPCYIYVSRLIINEVRIGDFLYKFFQVKEPELEENLLKTILYKKAKPITTETPENTTEQPATPPTEEKKEEQATTQPAEEKKEEQPVTQPVEEKKEEQPPTSAVEEKKEEVPNPPEEVKPEEKKEEPKTTQVPEELELPKEVKKEEKTE